MELFIALGLPIVLIFGITLLFMKVGIPSLVQKYQSNSSMLWYLGIIAMSTVTIIIYLVKR